MNVQSALNAYKETNLSEIEDATPHRLIELTFQDLKKNLLLNLFYGILFSVVVYYLSHFSNLLGENGRFPLILSVWFPIIVLMSASIIGVIRINEK